MTHTIGFGINKAWTLGGSRVGRTGWRQGRSRALGVIAQARSEAGACAPVPYFHSNSSERFGCVGGIAHFSLASFSTA